MGISDHLTCLLRNLYSDQDKKQQLEPDMEQQTGSTLGKEYVKTVYCHPAYLTYMQSTSCKMPGWMKHKLESRLPGEVLNCGVGEHSWVSWTGRRSNKSILNESWIFIGRTDAEAETPILWPPDVNSRFIEKDPDVGKDWRWEEKEITEDEMVR